MTSLHLLRTTAAAAALTCCAGFAHAAVVFQQAPGTHVTYSNGSTSQRLEFGAGSQTFDEFTTTRDATITQVEWRGTYFDGWHGSRPSTILWTVEFYSGSGAYPQNKLYSQTFRQDWATRTLVDRNNPDVDIYDFSLDLDGFDFDVVAGQQYWFSVVSYSGGLNPYFSWTNADSTGRAVMGKYDNTGRLTTFETRTNRAFTLIDNTVAANTVPEPASLALVAGALVAGGAATRRTARA